MSEQRMNLISAKLALQADLCYNEASNIIALAVLATPRAVHLYRRCTLDSLSQKRCTKCNNLFPATTAYFSRQKTGLKSWCKQCQSEYRATYYAEHREQEKQRMTAYGEVHREELRQYSAQYRKEHPEEVRQSNARYNAEHREERRLFKVTYNASHREERRAYKSKWHEEHREEQRQYSAEYNASHRNERIKYGRQRRAHYREELNARHRQYRHTEHGRLTHRAHQNRRRARQLQTSGFYSSQDILLQDQRQKGKCYWCQAKLVRYHIDHIIPLSRGGSNEPDNIVLACPTCNMSRNNRLPHEWDKGGRLL